MEKDHFFETEKGNDVLWHPVIRRDDFQIKDQNSVFDHFGCPNNRGRNEQRIRKRFKMGKEVFAIIRSQKTAIEHEKEMTMAEIAVSVYKSQPLKLGRLKNVSTNSLCMSYIDYAKENAGPLKLDLLVIMDHFFIDGITFEVIYDIESQKKSSFDNFRIRQLGVVFKHLTPVQTCGIHRLIQQYTVS